ncbi:hypothetical protein HDU98_005126, partial [Podochytrium sp. JEL0797]
MTASPKDALKQECTQLKAAEIPFKLSPASPTNPFPLVLNIRVPQPADCHMFDIYEIVFRLTIDSFDTFDAKISVDGPANGIDPQLALRIEKNIAQYFDTHTGGWRLNGMVQFVSKAYGKLLRLVPGTLDMYMGDDAEGRSMRRYGPAFIKAKEVEQTQEEKDAAAEAEAEAAAEYWRKRREEEHLALLEKERKAAEERRIEALNDPSMNEKPRQLSKKELDEIHKSKQGVRMSKTGPNKKKFDPEAAAARKEAR